MSENLRVVERKRSLSLFASLMIPRTRPSLVTFGASAAWNGSAIDSETRFVIRRNIVAMKLRMDE